MMNDFGRVRNLFPKDLSDRLHLQIGSYTPGSISFHSDIPHHRIGDLEPIWQVVQQWQ